jgi:hypothetical protein
MPRWRSPPPAWNHLTPTDLIDLYCHKSSLTMGTGVSKLARQAEVLLTLMRSFH